MNHRFIFALLFALIHLFAAGSSAQSCTPCTKNNCLYTFIIPSGEMFSAYSLQQPCSAGFTEFASNIIVSSTDGSTFTVCLQNTNSSTSPCYASGSMSQAASCYNSPSGLLGGGAQTLYLSITCANPNKTTQVCSLLFTVSFGCIPIPTTTTTTTTTIATTTTTTTKTTTPTTTPPPTMYVWFAGEFSTCSSSCNQWRDVYCMLSSSGKMVANSFCDSSTEPASSEQCIGGDCVFAYSVQLFANPTCTFSYGFPIDWVQVAGNKQCAQTGDGYFVYVSCQSALPSSSWQFWLYDSSCSGVSLNYTSGTGQMCTVVPTVPPISVIVTCSDGSTCYSDCGSTPDNICASSEVQQLSCGPEEWNNYGSGLMCGWHSKCEENWEIVGLVIGGGVLVVVGGTIFVCWYNRRHKRRAWAARVLSQQKDMSTATPIPLSATTQTQPLFHHRMQLSTASSSQVRFEASNVPQPQAIWLTNPLDATGFTQQNV